MSEHLTSLPTLRTERLTLVALTPAAYTAWAAGDPAAARWNPEAIGWWGWLATLTATGEPVGSVGFAGHPDDGVATIGYSVYEGHRGLGYGTEATAAAVGWALSHDGVDGVRATIPDWNAPTLRLAEKVGFVMTGPAQGPEVGEVLVYEIGRP